MRWISIDINFKGNVYIVQDNNVLCQNVTGYVLLAMIIEKVTGVLFDQYLKTNTFDVCDMKSTGYYKQDRLLAKCANNYIYCAETKDYRTNIYSVDVKGTGAGGAVISVKDIINFWKGLLGEKLISKGLVSKMLSKQNGDGIDAKNGKNLAPLVREMEMCMEKNGIVGYEPLVNGLKQLIKKKQYHVLQMINSETINLYWKIGEEIYRQQSRVSGLLFFFVTLI